MAMISALFVFLGGGLGSLCRYALGLWPGHWGSFPLGTFVANALSCIVLGAAVALASRHWLSADYRLLLVTGFCGGFSTFSTFTNEWIQLCRQGQWALASAYVMGSLVVGGLALWVGLRLAGGRL